MENFSGLEKGKLYTVAGIEEIRISAKTGVDIVFDDDSKNVLVGEFDRFDLNTPLGDVVRAFVDTDRDLENDELAVLVEVEARPDGELELASIVDYEMIVDPYDETIDELEDDDSDEDFDD